MSNLIKDINNIKYKESNLFINLAAIKVLFQTNKIHKICKLFQRINLKMQKIE